MKTMLVTAGGKIRCVRCTASSSRTGQQCGRPALNASRTKKCQFHGGRGSGPKTAAGRARIAAAHTVHGEDTKLERARRSAESARLSQLEDAARLLGMLAGARTRGRKASGYVRVTTVEDVKRMMTDDLLRCASAVVQGG
jgi:hypothetical protein